MIDVYYSPKGTPYVMASDLRDMLGVKTQLNTWFPRMIDYGFEENKDYYKLPKNGEVKNERFEWAVTVDMAKNIAMIQRTPEGKAIRDYLLQLDQKVNDGEYLNQGQIMALMDICKVMGYFSVQKFFEKEHYEKIFKGSDTEWWQRRASLFGYSAAELKKALLDVGEKYKNQKQALFKTDRFELIRTGIIDMFIVMGKSIAFAKNVGNIAKTMAEKIDPHIYDDLNTPIDFKSEEQKLIITDLKNYQNHSSLFKRFTGGKQTNPALSKNHNQLDLGIDNKTSGNKGLDDALGKALNKKLK